MPNTPTNTGTNKGSGVFDVVNAFISARDVAPVPSVLENVADVAKQTGSAARSVLATTVDAALGVAEATLAAPVNAVGLASQVTNAAIVRPVHNARAAMRQALFGENTAA